MNCERFNAWLQESLDAGGVPVPEDVQLHLAGCAECRNWKEAAGKLQVGLRFLPAPSPSPGLSSRIVALVLHENRARRRQRRQRWTALALAASVLIAIGVLLAVRFSKEPAGRQSVAHSDNGSSTSHSEVAHSGGPKASTLPQLLGDLLALGLHPGSSSQGGRNRIAYAIETALGNLGAQKDKGPETVAEGIEGMGSLVSLRLRRTAEEGKTLLDIVNPMSTASSQAGGGTPPLVDPGDSVQAGLKPVTGSAKRAVDLFVREVPGMGTDK